MGYYNDHYPPNPHRKKRQNWLVPILLGVIIGILLVVVAVPSILDSNIIPDKWATQQKSNEDGGKDGMRSEEHTSELQSRGHLVCRLLLEKKSRDTTVFAT